MILGLFLLDLFNVLYLSLNRFGKRIKLLIFTKMTQNIKAAYIYIWEYMGNYRGGNFLGAISWEAIICWAKMWETIVRSSIIWAAIDRGSKIWGRIVRGSITMRAIAQGQLSRGQLCCSQGPHTHNNMKNITLFFIYCFHALALAYEQEKSKNNI